MSTKLLPRIIESPNQDQRPQGISIDCVIIHYTDLPLRETLRLLCQPHRASTHYVISRNGILFQLVSPDMRAWHAGVSCLHGQERVNDFSVGIDLVFVPRVHRFYTDLQYTTLKLLIEELQSRYPIPSWRILGHEHVARPAGRKMDPGPLFEWGRLGLHQPL